MKVLENDWIIKDGNDKISILKPFWFEKMFDIIPKPQKISRGGIMEEKIKKVNELIKLITSLDRDIFTDTDGFMSYFLIINNRVAYIDKYTRNIIKEFPESGGWFGFSNGGTIRELVRELVLFIRNGKPRYKDYYCTHWGYSEESVKKIKEKMIEIGFVKCD